MRVRCPRGCCVLRTLCLVRVRWRGDCLIARCPGSSGWCLIGGSMGDADGGGVGVPFPLAICYTLYVILSTREKERIRVLGDHVGFATSMGLALPERASGRASKWIDSHQGGSPRSGSGGHSVRQGLSAIGRGCLSGGLSSRGESELLHVALRHTCSGCMA